MAYLGLGAILLVAFVAVRWLASARPRPSLHPGRQRWLWIACAAMAVFALSSRVTLLGHSLFSLESFYDLFGRLIAPFRSSGRFLWPLHYLILVGSIALLARTSRPGSRLPAVVLGFALILQAADQPAFLRGRTDPAARLLESEAWERIAGSYDHLSGVPPAVKGAESCAGFGRGALPLADLAWRHGLTFDGGYVARADPERLAEHCRTISSRAESGRLEERTIYVVDETLYPDGLPGARCGLVEGRLVCVRRENRDPLARTLIGEAPPAAVH